MSRVHQLLEAIQKRDVDLVDTNLLCNFTEQQAVKECWNLLDSLSPAIATANKFYIDALADEMDVLFEEKFSEMADELWEAGVLNMPFDHCLFEFAYGDRSCACFHAVSRESMDEVRPLTYVSVYVLNSSTDRWSYAPVDVVVPRAIETPDRAPWSFETPGGGHAITQIPRYYEISNLLDHDGELFRDLRNKIATAPRDIINLCCFLITKAATTNLVAVSPKLNRRRQAADKPPLFEHRVVRLAPWAAALRQNGGGSHASPRLHWRRGHVRTLANGMQVPVAPCLVGLADRGTVTKDYVVRTNSAIRAVG